LILFKALQAMSDMGYAYAIIRGGEGVEWFYKSVDAMEIEGSQNGIYRDFLNHN